MGAAKQRPPGRGKQQEMKRPFTTLFFTDARMGKHPVSWGAAKTFDGAKKSTVVRVLLGQYRCAVIIDRRLSQVLMKLRLVDKNIIIDREEGTP